MNNSFPKKKWPEEARNVLRNADCQQRNQARTRTVSVLPGTAPGPLIPLPFTCNGRGMHRFIPITAPQKHCSQ